MTDIHEHTAQQTAEDGPTQATARFLSFSPQFFQITNQNPDAAKELELLVGGLIYCPTDRCVGHSPGTPIARGEHLEMSGRTVNVVPVATFLFDTEEKTMCISDVLAFNGVQEQHQIFRNWFNPQFGAPKEWFGPENGTAHSICLPAQALLPVWWDFLAENNPHAVDGFAVLLKNLYVRGVTLTYHPNYILTTLGEGLRDGLKPSGTWLEDLPAFAQQAHPVYCTGPTSEQVVSQRLEACLDVVGIEIAKHRVGVAEDANPDKIASPEQISAAIMSSINKDKLQREALLDARLVAHSARCAQHFYRSQVQEGFTEVILRRAERVAVAHATAINALKSLMLVREVADRLHHVERADGFPSVFPSKSVAALREKDPAGLEGINIDWKESLFQIEEIAKQMHIAGTAPDLDVQAIKALQFFSKEGYAAFYPGGSPSKENDPDLLFYNLACLFVLKHLVLYTERPEVDSMLI